MTSIGTVFCLRTSARPVDVSWLITRTTHKPDGSVDHARTSSHKSLPDEPRRAPEQMMEASQELISEN